jgi:hypothetical protein
LDCAGLCLGSLAWHRLHHLVKGQLFQRPRLVEFLSQEGECVGGALLAFCQGKGKSRPGEQTCFIIPSPCRAGGWPAMGGRWDGESSGVCDLAVARDIGLGKALSQQNPPQHLSLLPVWQALAKSDHLLVGCHPRGHRPEEKVPAPRLHLLQDRPPPHPPRQRPVPPVIGKAIDPGGPTISSPTRSHVGGLLGWGLLASGKAGCVWVLQFISTPWGARGAAGRPLAATLCKCMTSLSLRESSLLGLAY